MNERITQARAEDAIARTSAFLRAERGAPIDGAFASRQLGERVASTRQRAEAILRSVPHQRLNGLYIPLSKHNANRYSEVATALPGYLVLVPSALVDKGTNMFYPAVVSEDGIKSGAMRLQVLRQPYRQKIGYGAAVALSAAGQSKTRGVGEHGRKSHDGIEAEHFATLLAAGSDPRVQSAWRAGTHVNHAWRKRADSSVTTEISRRLFGSDIPQATITITRQQVEDGQAMLLWHEGMREPNTGRAETATVDNALVVIQGLGFEALRTQNPRGTEDVKRLLS